MKFNRRFAGLRLKPSGDGLLWFPRLTRETRATLVGIQASDDSKIRLLQDGHLRPENWERRYWIPIGGNQKWQAQRTQQFFVSRTVG